MQRYSITWKNFTPQHYSVFEDPLFGQIDREAFLETYGPLLLTFDGRSPSAHIDFYFEKSPLNSSALIFRDAFRRDRFLEEAQRMELLPGMKEITEGESQFELEERRAQERQKVKLAAKKKEMKVSSEAKMILHSQQTLARLTLKLTTEINLERRWTLQEKIQRITAFLASKHNTV